MTLVEYIGHLVAVYGGVRAKVTHNKFVIMDQNGRIIDEVELRGRDDDDTSTRACRSAASRTPAQS